MLRSFVSEWVKLRRRSVLIAAVAMSGFAALGAYFGLVRATNPGGRGGGLTALVVQSDVGLTTVLSRGAGLIDAIALILVAANVGAEYSQGTLRNLLVREPRRVRMVSGKFVALVVFTMMAVTVAMVVGIITGFLGAAHLGLNTAAWTSDSGIGNLLTFYGNLLLATFGWCVLGLFFALLFRSAAAAVGVALAYALIVEGLLSELWPDSVPQWLYGRLTASILSGGGVLSTEAPVSTYGRALLIVGIYIVILLGVGVALFRGRDVAT